MKFDWITPQQAAEKWGISDRRAQALCANGQIDGVMKLGLGWLIPKSAAKPEDGRKRNRRKPSKIKQENQHGQKEK